MYCHDCGKEASVNRPLMQRKDEVKGVVLVCKYGCNYLVGPCRGCGTTVKLEYAGDNPELWARLTFGLSLCPKCYEPLNRPRFKSERRHWIEASFAVPPRIPAPDLTPKPVLCDDGLLSPRLAVGTKVRLGKRQLVDPAEPNSSNWNIDMNDYVGKVGEIIDTGGRDMWKCRTYRVDIGGGWAWRSANMEVVKGES